MKSLRFRNLIQGRPIFIIKDGVLQQKALKQLRYTVDDVLDALRQKDIFNIADVQNAVVETNGTLTVQKKSDSSDDAGVAVPLIMDGKPVNEYFAGEISSDNKIEVLAAALGYKSKDIMLLTLDNDGKTYIIKKDEQ